MIEMKRYKALNELASQGGIVILGSGKDCDIPLCELKQAFSLDADLYNRSASTLSIADAEQFYTACVAELRPETLLIHIGQMDTDLFRTNSSEFDKKYRRLIAKIRDDNKKCDIAVVSLENDSENDDISEMNKHLKYIAESERCEFSDISKKRVWNPKGTRDLMSFISSVGFVRPLNIKRPLYDLVRILFRCDPCCEE